MPSCPLVFESRFITYPFVYFPEGPQAYFAIVPIRRGGFTIQLSITLQTMPQGDTLHRLRRYCVHLEPNLLDTHSPIAIPDCDSLAWSSGSLCLVAICLPGMIIIAHNEMRLTSAFAKKLSTILLSPVIPTV